MFVLEPIQQGEGKSDVQLSQPTNSVAPKTISEDNQLKLALREKMDFKNIDFFANIQHYMPWINSIKFR